MINVEIKQQYSKSIWNTFEKARKIALKSNYKYKLGAILIKGGKIINAKYNSSKTHKWATHLYKYGSRHAELSTLINLNYDQTCNSIIFVARTTKTKHFALSRPCSMCINAAKKMGVKKIYYTINDYEFGTICVNKY